jgi:hypothetical protein
MTSSRRYSGRSTSKNPCSRSPPNGRMRSKPRQWQHRMCPLDLAVTSSALQQRSSRTGRVSARTAFVRARVPCTCASALAAETSDAATHQLAGMPSATSRGPNIQSCAASSRASRGAGALWTSGLGDAAIRGRQSSHVSGSMRGALVGMSGLTRQAVTSGLAHVYGALLCQMKSDFAGSG